MSTRHQLRPRGHRLVRALLWVGVFYAATLVVGAVILNIVRG